MTTIRIATKYLALSEMGNGIIRISFSPKTIPNAIRIANTPPDAPTVRDRGIAQHVAVGKHRGGQRRADDAEGIELQKAARAPGAFEGRAEHPDAQHVAEPVPEFEMQEAVSHQLPERSVDNGLRLERQVVAHPAGNVDQGHPEEFKQQEDGSVHREQPGDRAGKGRQAQRHFSASCHDWLRCFFRSSLC